jgi:hypothetical protein
MEATYEKVIDDNGNVIGKITKEVYDHIDLVALDIRIAEIQRLLTDLLDAKSQFDSLPNPIK